MPSGVDYDGRVRRCCGRIREEVFAGMIIALAGTVNSVDPLPRAGCAYARQG